MIREILGAAALVGLLAAPVGADELEDQKAIDAICFEWGLSMGAEISRARLDPENDEVKAAGIAAAAYSRETGADANRAIKLAAPANAFAIEIYKLKPRKPETMGVYAYFVCQIHALTDRGLPTEQPLLDRIDALLARCEAESKDDQALLRCVGSGIDALAPAFPPRQDRALHQTPAASDPADGSGPVHGRDTPETDGKAP